MAIILCIETSGPVCSVALFQDFDTCLGQLKEEQTFQHAAITTVLIEQLLKDCNLKTTDLDAIAICGGPGSYTGLRIGTSIAKGLCYVLDIPLIAINSLEVLAFGFLQNQSVNETDIIRPAIDARRMEVYTAGFRGDLSIVSEPRSLVIDESSFQSDLDNSVMHFMGSGAAKISETIQHKHLHSHSQDFLSAKHIGPLAYTRWEIKDFEDTAYFEPYYLKAFHTTAKIK
ncbi:MAG: tRNA threonylcarbamoyladenosine biosynthesis protein TsaB [Bacteroidia bacterium]|jgi:tRNA threonylcarbamoyladenosine biosynthesis protein TsaB